MEAAPAKQRKAQQKAAKGAAADRRRMLNLKLDRRTCRRMSKMWQRREKDAKRSRISRVVQDSLLDGLLLVGDGTQAGELFQIVAAPCLDTPAVVVRYTTHFTPASASPSAGHMKRKSLRCAQAGHMKRKSLPSAGHTSVAHKLRQAAASAQGEVESLHVP
jgi:hypothetical protein